ncbi:MAG: universal stress protein [Desulfobacterales bacterium]|nr:universal stress protein [Desulfobacterales bacterium]
MLPKINNILYATDMSQNARHAFVYAADVADRHNARITVLNVIETLTQGANVMLTDILGEEAWKKHKESARRGLEEKMRGRLEDFCAEMDSELNECKLLVDQVVVRHGIPFEEILKLADEIEADMIVMGTHGHGVIADALIGGVSRGVIRRSKIPVLVIRLPKA